MASALGQRQFRGSEQGHTSIALSQRRRRVVCSAQRQANVDQRWSEDASHFTPAIAASLAAASLLCFTDTALAIQGGALEDYGLSPSTGGKGGVQLEEARVKALFTPSEAPKKEAPKPAEPAPAPKPKAEKKKAPPVKAPPVKAPPVKAPEKAVVKKTPSKPKLELPKESRPAVSGDKVKVKPSLPKAITKEKPSTKPTPLPKLELPKSTKPAPSKKQPVQPPAPPKSPPSLPKSLTPPSISLPSPPSISLPSISGSPSGATQAAVLVGIEVLLVLIASATVNSLLKKA